MIQEGRMFSWKKALKHGGIVFLVLVAAGAAVAGAGLVKDPEKFGEGSARFVLVGVGLAMVVSYLFQVGRRRAAWGAIIGLILLVGGIAAAIVLGGRNTTVRLTADEKRALAIESIDGKSWLVHPGLRFAVLYPGPDYAAAPPALLRAAFSADLDTHVDGWFDRDHGRLLLVMLTSMHPSSKRDLAHMVSGIKQGLGKSLGVLIGGSELATIREEVREGEAHIHMGAGQAHLRVNAWESMYGDRGRTVLVVTVSADDDALAEVAESFRRL